MTNSNSNEIVNIIRELIIEKSVFRLLSGARGSDIKRDIMASDQPMLVWYSGSVYILSMELTVCVYICENNRGT